MKLRNMFIILQREYTQRVKKRSFIISTLLTPIIMLGFMIVPALLTNHSINEISETVRLGIVDESGIIGQHLQDSESIDYTLLCADSIAQDHNLSAIIYLNKDIVSRYRDIKVDRFDDKFTMTVESKVRYNLNSVIRSIKIKSYNIEGLSDIMADANVNVSFKTVAISESGDKKETSTLMSLVLGGIGAFMIYMFILIYGSQVLASVIDEKNSKIMEVMVSTVSPMHMMMGKILGVGAVAITQFAIWVILAFIGGTAFTSFMGDSLAPSSGIISELVVMLNSVSDIVVILKVFMLFVVFFIGGYLFYAACFAAIASAVDNIQDAQQFQIPIMMPLIIAIISISAVLQNPTSDLSFWLSIIPFTSPVIMVIRIVNDIPLWEVLLSLGLLYTSFFGMLWMAGRIYRVGIFVHGRKPSYKELYRWIKYK